VPLAAMGRTIPGSDANLVATNTVFDKHGFGLPDGMKVWLRSQAPDEVLIVGGHTDANVLAAGFDVFNLGYKSAIVPLLNYGNDWYMHTVTAKIWEADLGKVYQSVAELKFGGL
jgi:nicotinamidase-related amidase